MLVLVTLLLFKETATFWSWSCPCSIKAAWVSRNTFCGLPTSCITKSTRTAILKILQWDLETCRLGMRPSMDHNNVAMTGPRATMAGKPWHIDTKGSFAKQFMFAFAMWNNNPLPGSLVTIALHHWILNCPQGRQWKAVFSYWKGDAEARYFAHVAKLHIKSRVALHIGN